MLKDHLAYHTTKLRTTIKQDGSTWVSFLKNFPVRQTFTLLPGVLIAFNNHQMLHSCNGFQLNGGVRNLQGCYVNIDNFKSAVLSQCKLHYPLIITRQHGT